MPGSPEEPRVVDDLVPLDVAREEVVGERRVAGDRAEHGLQIVDRVRRLDVAGHVDAGLAEASPTARA